MCELLRGDIVHSHCGNYPERDLLGWSDKLRGRFMVELPTIPRQKLTTDRLPRVFMTGPLLEYNNLEDTAEITVLICCAISLCWLIYR